MSHFKHVGLASLILVLSAVFFAPQVTMAQSACLDIQSNLSVGQRGGQITGLQNFLIQRGDLNGRADGIFGNQTRTAVIAFQRAQGIAPLSGLVGSLTQAAIKNLTCGAGASLSTSTQVYAPAIPASSASAADRLSRPVRLLSGCVAGQRFHTASGQPCEIVDTALPAGCTAASLFSPTTGQPCNALNATLPPGCYVGALYSSTTGQPCSQNTNNTVIALKPSVRLVQAPAEHDNVLNEGYRAVAYGANLNGNNVVILLRGNFEEHQIFPANKYPGSLEFIVPKIIRSGDFNLSVVSDGEQSNLVSVRVNKLGDTNVNQSKLIPSISSVTPQPVQVGQTMTVYFTNGGDSGGVALKTLDGSKSWFVPYTTGIVYNGFQYYDGSKITFTVPPTIGQGQLPENSGYEQPIAITSGTYNLYVTSGGLTSNNSVIREGGVSNTVKININATSQATTTLHLLTPNGGQTYRAGDPINVTWTSQNPKEYVVNIQIVPANWARNMIIPSGNYANLTEGYCNRTGGCIRADAGSASFTMPQTLAPGAYRLRIGCNIVNTDSLGECYDRVAEDLSDAPFTITAPAANAQPTVRITSPNGGETLKIGQTYRITWDSANVDKVTLGYSFGEGSLSWFSGNSANNIPNAGYYDWNVNIGTRTSGSLKIYIIGYNTGVGSMSDYSDGFVSVESASSTSAWPAGCGPGVAYSYTSGQACNPPSLPEGCTAGMLFSWTTGKPCKE